MPRNVPILFLMAAFCSCSGEQLPEVIAEHPLVCFSIFNKFSRCIEGSVLKCLCAGVTITIWPVDSLLP